ncbi:MAG: hypothetical protein HY070_09760 [Chloroflexi bacterium]|nr:hypothetical protein [Chloroflexota bacterium]
MTLLIFFAVSCAPVATPTRAANSTPSIARSITPTFAPTRAAKINPLCATATLEDLIKCIATAMPKLNSNAYVVPNNSTLKDWETVVAQMLAGKCDEIILPATLQSAYLIYTFTDKGNNANYCVAAEIADENKNGIVDRGWGTFIVNNKSARELSIQAPHPLYDLDTENQAVGVFKQVGARSYVLAGAHRDANIKRTACEPDTGEGEADGAHNENTFFQHAVIALKDYYDANEKNWAAIQFHGMSATACPNVDAFISMGNGKVPAPGSISLTLKANILKVKPNWVVTVPGDTPPCDLSAGTNVAGRLLNGVPAPNVCAIAATTTTGKFIHIEQKREMRVVNEWAQAIMLTWQ